MQPLTVFIRSAPSRFQPLATNPSPAAQDEFERIAGFDFLADRTALEAPEPQLAQERLQVLPGKYYVK